MTVDAREVAERVGQAQRREPVPVSVHDYGPPLTPEEFKRQATKMEAEQAGRGGLVRRAEEERAEVAMALERIERDGHTAMLDVMARDAMAEHEVRALGAFRPERGELSMGRQWLAWYRGDVAVEWLRKVNRGNR